MKLRLLFLLLIAGATCATAQPQWSWAKKEPAAVNTNISYSRHALAVSGNRTFWGVILNKKITYGQSVMGDHIFRELDSSGNVLSSLTATGKFAMAEAQADAAGNWYVLGTFYDSISLSPALSLTRDPMGASSNYILFRLHAGTLAPDWLQLVGNNGFSSAACFTIANNQLYLPMDSSFSTHIYKYSLATGAATKLFTQTGRTTTSFIQADSAGNIYLMGSCVINGALNFNGTASTAPNSNAYPWYIARYHANGQHHWHYYMTDITCQNRSFLLNGNNALYLSGPLSDSTTLAGYHFNKPAGFFNADYLFARLDSNGGLVWAQQRPVTGTAQGSIFFNSQFNTAVADTVVYLFCESSGNSSWGSAVTSSTPNRHLATLVAFNALTGSALWAKTINGIYTSAQHLITDGYSLWAAGNGSDSNFIKFDTVSIPTVQGIYVPYIAKMNVAAKPKVSTPPATGIAASVQSLPIRVWPNPAAGAVMLDGLSGKETIRLRDMTGRIILQPVNSGNSMQRIITNTLARGVYFLEIETGGVRMVTRLLLE